MKTLFRALAGAAIFALSGGWAHADEIFTLDIRSADPAILDYGSDQNYRFDLADDWSGFGDSIEENIIILGYQTNAQDDYVVIQGYYFPYTTAELLSERNIDGSSKNTVTYKIAFPGIQNGVSGQQVIVTGEVQWLAPYITRNTAFGNTSHDGSTQITVVFNAVNFDSALGGYDSSKVVADNGRVDSVDFSGNTITVTITPLATEDITVTLQEGFWSHAYPDGWGTGGTIDVSTLEMSATVPYGTADTTAPTITDITGEAIYSDSDTELSYEISLSEPVAGLNRDDFSISGANFVSLAGIDGTLYEDMMMLIVEPDGSGNDIDFTIRTGNFYDASGNHNEQAYTWSSDFNGPTVYRFDDGALPAVANMTGPSDFSDLNTTLTYTFEWSELITLVHVIDFKETIENATFQTWSVDDSSGKTVVTVEVKPDGGDVDLAFKANSIEDLFGNENDTAYWWSGFGGPTLDLTPPFVKSMDGPDSFIGINNNVLVTIRFTKPVSGFDDASDFSSITGGTVASITSADQTIYTVEITPNGSGNIDFTIAAGAVVDIDGKTNAEASTYSTVTGSAITYIEDFTLPVIEAIDGEPTYSDLNAILVYEVTWSEIITDLGEGDFVHTFQGGTLDHWSADNSSGKTVVTIGINPDGGDIDFGFSASSVEDLAGNLNQAEQLWSDFNGPTTYIDGPPQVRSIDGPHSKSDFSGNAIYTIVFWEWVDGFEQSDFTFENCDFVGLTTSDNITYELEVSPSAAGGDMDFTILARAVQDVDDSSNADPYSWSDYGGPTLEDGDFQFTATQPVATGFGVYEIYIGTPGMMAFHRPTGESQPLDLTNAANNVTVGNATMTRASFALITGVDTSNCVAGAAYCQKYHLTRDNTGTITLTIPEKIWMDDSRRFNTAFFMSFDDSTAPEVASWERDGGGYSNITDMFTVTITFTEQVAGLDASGLTVENATIERVEVDASDASIWYVDLLPEASGAIELSVNIGAVSDANGNVNAQISSMDPVLDWINSVPVLSTSTTEYTSRDVMTVTIEADRPVSGLKSFTVINVESASDHGLSPNDETAVVTSYDLTIEPFGSGPITLRIPAGAPD